MSYDHKILYVNVNLGEYPMTVLSNRNYSRAIAIIAVFLMVACTKTTSTPINPENTTSILTVQVFYSPPTDREYTELGLVTTQTGQTIFHDRSAEGMIAKLQNEAARMGADAIIVRSANEGTWGLKGGGNTGFERGNAQAVAIKFK
jgi:hypothetical protein